MSSSWTAEGMERRSSRPARRGTSSSALGHSPPTTCVISTSCIGLSGSHDCASSCWLVGQSSKASKAASNLLTSGYGSSCTCMAAGDSIGRMTSHGRGKDGRRRRGRATRLSELWPPFGEVASAFSVSGRVEGNRDDKGRGVLREEK
eukprot:3967228-Prymnesium_polylepis.1